MERMKAMCIQVRQSGLLSLESQIDQEPDSLMRKGMRLIVDGTSPQYTREALELTLQVIDERHKARAKIFEAAGGYSPTMGIIGTVLGLVHVLSDLQEPDTLGPKIAMAFIATLYGIGLANLFWLWKLDVTGGSTTCGCMSFPRGFADFQGLSHGCDI